MKILQFPMNDLSSPRHRQRKMNFLLFSSLNLSKNVQICIHHIFLFEIHELPGKSKSVFNVFIGILLEITEISLYEGLTTLGDVALRKFLLPD
jgi:hypothetical protein